MRTRCKNSCSRFRGAEGQAAGAAGQAVEAEGAGLGEVADLAEEDLAEEDLAEEEDLAAVAEALAAVPPSAEAQAFAAAQV